MSTRRAAAAATAVTILASLSLTLAACSSGPSAEDRCAKALAARPSGDTSKPHACDSLKGDDYDLLNGDAIMHSKGIIDSDGNVDMSKLLDTTNTP